MYNDYLAVPNLYLNVILLNPTLSPVYLGANYNIVHSATFACLLSCSKCNLVNREFLIWQQITLLLVTLHLLNTNAFKTKRKTKQVNN